MYKLILIGDEEYNREHVVLSIQDIVPDTDNTRVSKHLETSLAHVALTVGLPASRSRDVAAADSLVSSARFDRGQSGFFFPVACRCRTERLRRRFSGLSREIHCLFAWVRLWANTAPIDPEVCGGCKLGGLWAFNRDPGTSTVVLE